jgi:hypothetical protein
VVAVTRPTLTVLNTYSLQGSAAEFTVAITALAARVELAGHPGILSYRFFVKADQRLARAVIDYADPAAWIGHHEIAMLWPEMKALHDVATLRHVAFLGPLTDDIHNWLAQSGLQAEIEAGYVAAAGFARV